MLNTTAPNDLLRDIAGTLKGEFAARRSVLSFREYLALVAEKPRHHLRSSAQYVVDTFDHFGSYDRALPTGTIRRFRLFDGAFPEANLKVAGQERVQNKVYQLLKGFARDGRTTKLILLHGPTAAPRPASSIRSSAGLNTTRAPTTAPCTATVGSSPRRSTRRAASASAAERGPRRPAFHPIWPRTRT